MENIKYGKQQYISTHSCHMQGKIKYGNNIFSTFTKNITPSIFKLLDFTSVQKCIYLFFNDPSWNLSILTAYHFFHSFRGTCLDNEDSLRANINRITR